MTGSTVFSSLASVFFPSGSLPLVSSYFPAYALPFAELSSVYWFRKPFNEALPIIPGCCALLPKMLTVLSEIFGTIGSSLSTGVSLSLSLIGTSPALDGTSFSSSYVSFSPKSSY